LSILVTGAGGLVGRHLVALPGTIGLDRTQLDICDPAAVSRALDHYSPSVVINAAAFAHVDGCERDPARAWRVNAGGVDVLAQAAKARRLRLLHLSTDYVLGGDGLTLSVDAASAPLGVYARSKWGGEQAARAAEATIVRLQWVYSSSTSSSSFVDRAIQRMAAGDSVSLVTDQLGCPTPAALLAQWLVELARLRVLPAIVHLATTGAATPQQWICALAEAQGITPLWHPIVRADLPGASRPARSCLDVSETERLFGRTLPNWHTALRAPIR